MAEGMNDFDVETASTPDSQQEITTVPLPPTSVDSVRVRVDYSFLRTAPGALKLLHIIFTIASLVCVTTANYAGLNYLSLPLAGRSRFFVFTSVVSLLATTAIVFFHSTGLSRKMPINWHLFDFLLCLFLSFLYLVASSLIGSACVIYQNKYSDWTAVQLPTGVILGYVCLVLYGVGAVLGYRKWKRGSQFLHRRLERRQQGCTSTNVLT
ncbi:CKLF-like MARVEL transmembrane domain-containing protein 4 [Ptychodera flava]|uniref:CKLF-like MARVEL transmembrane domain-containing protein 4 n=1 Tax=Ptychodera flava TaxID=63121 RepID=UPI00396A5988